MSKINNFIIQNSNIFYHMKNNCNKEKINNSNNNYKDRNISEKMNNLNNTIFNDSNNIKF